MSIGTNDKATSASAKAVDKNNPYADDIQRANQEDAIVINTAPPLVYKCTA